MNPGFKLGIIVLTRIQHDWDRHRAEYVQTLMTNTRETAAKVQLEAIRFASDAMAVHQRVLGNAFKKYLQTGNEDDLGPHKDAINIRNYKEYTGLFLQLTGQDKEKKVTGDIHHTHTSAPDMRTIDASLDGADILKMMDKK